ncbi:MAG: hypothetical protein STSR0008_05800 [Ignavibacterium sp.]
MPTILELINLSTEYLSKKGIESPRLNAELLLADILNYKRLDLYTNFEQPLKENEINKYREYIRQRAHFEPLQYIIGKTEFYGLTFKVNKNVLIPRPETEILVEKILEELKIYDEVNILDIGTGSGNIAIALAKNLLNSKITAIDTFKEAILIAKENSIINKVSDKINFNEVDILKNNFSFDNKFDLVVSNPPYINFEEYKNLQKEIVDYEPPSSLTDYENGLKFFNVIINKIKNILKPTGKIFFEIGFGQADDVKKILLENNFHNIKIYKDYSNIERVISGELICE